MPERPLGLIDRIEHFPLLAARFGRQRNAEVGQVRRGQVRQAEQTLEVLSGGLRIRAWGWK